MRAFGLLSVALLATVACDDGYRFDDGFCDRHPGDPACPIPAGSAGAQGAAGLAGAGGSSGAGSGGTSGLGGGGSGGVGGLVCSAPAVDCSGACVNIQGSDAKNCGACERSCRGGTCEEGACVPEALTSGGEVAPYALVADATQIYWASPARKDGAPTRLRRAPKEGPAGAGEDLFPNVEVRTRSLASAGGKLYWGDLGASPGVLSGTPGTSFPDGAAFAAGQLDVRSLVVAAGKAFWSVGGSAAVRGRPLAGGALAPDVLGQDNPGWIAADATGAIYWVAGATPEVRRTKAGAPGYETFAAGQGVAAVELAGGRVYWSEAAAGVVRSAGQTEAPPVGGAVEFSGHGRVEGLALADSALYALTLEGGALKLWRKGEVGEPLLLGRVVPKEADYAGNPLGPSRLVLDADYVYFADPGTVDTGQVVPASSGDGVVYRVPK